MYFDYEQFVNIVASIVIGYRYDIVHSNTTNRDKSDGFGIFYDIEMREMPPIPISFRCRYYRYDEFVLDESVCI